MQTAPAFQPMADHVLISRAEAEAMTPGGLHVPSQARAELNAGTVIACGPSALAVKPGDRIVFAKFAATSLTIDDRPFAIIREADVLGVES